MLLLPCIFVLATFGAHAASPPAVQDAAPQEQAQASLSPDALLAKLDSFRKVTWKKGDEAANVDILTRVKVEELKGILDATSQLLATDATRETAEAVAYINGAACLAYADIAYDFPPPSGLSQEERTVQAEQTSTRFVLPSEDKATSYLTTLLSASEPAGSPSQWRTKSLQLLSEQYPHESPSTDSKTSSPPVGSEKDRKGIADRVKTHRAFGACVDHASTSNPAVAGKVAVVSPK
jgi:hypothetical protein